MHIIQVPDKKQVISAAVLNQFLQLQLIPISMVLADIGVLFLYCPPGFLLCKISEDVILQIDNFLCLPSFKTAGISGNSQVISKRRFSESEIAVLHRKNFYAPV